MKSYLFLFFSFLFSLTEVVAQPVLDAAYFQSLKHTHDLNLPEWGPYTKKYSGISHIPNKEQGIRFDLSVFPGFYRRKTEVPNVFYESGFHPWESSPNFEYVSFRHELEWKDKVYTDVSYSQIDDNSRLVRVECVNNTDLKQSIVLHLMASIHFPSIAEYNPNTPLNYCSIKLPEYASWIDALDYKTISIQESAYRNNLVYDGKLRGEIRDHGLINGSGIGQKFGSSVGDSVAYEVDIQVDMKQAIVWIRYKLEKGKQAQLELKGLTTQTLTLKGTGNIEAQSVDLNDVNIGKHRLTFTSKSTTPVILDGFTIIKKTDETLIQIDTVKWNHVPHVEKQSTNSIILKYDNCEKYYGVYWNYPESEVRQWFYSDLNDDFKRMVNEHVKKEFHNGTDGHFTNVFLSPIHLDPHSSSVINGFVCAGSMAEVEQKLSEKITDQKATEIYKQARAYLPDYTCVPEGETYVFSQKRMAATTQTNVVYPVYTQREYIKHHSPGRWWDCLYTWDSGFIGIGLSRFDVKRGIENLNAYVNDLDEQSAFIHHGTPLPVQHYLFLELWNKTQSKELLEAYYPKLKHYYEFIAGINPSSTTLMKSGFTKTWDYFYNSGGWDDYPPQKYVHQQKLEKTVAPIVSTSHAIRVAKILQMVATHLNKQEDVALYEKQIGNMTNAIQNYAWDNETGYFGYVVHDETEKVKDILRYNGKLNYNMGLDGASPIIAGICTKEQKNRLLNHLKTKGEIWSDIGMSAVDQSAPYYSASGYWNGTVWMPHQWFFWKTMLDLGEADFAYKIAKTGLDLWKKETEDTYNCYEHFVIETARGAGWHQFGGLSTPVLHWFEAYYKPGNLTTGFNTWIVSSTFDKTNSGLRAELKLFDKDNSSSAVIVCLNPLFDYNVFWNNNLVKHDVLNKGTLSVMLPNTSQGGILRIEKK